MKKWTSLTAMLIMTLSLFACGTPKPDGRSAVLVVSFGTSFPETRALTIEAIEQETAKAFPGWDVKRAFTSKIIRNVIKKKEGTEILAPGAMLDQLKKEGYVNIVVQPSHVLQGAEYNELLGEIKDKKQLFKSFKVGKPLLSDDADYVKTVDALAAQFPKGKTVVLMGHGNGHHPEYNKSYMKLQKIFDEKKMPVHLGLVEGAPGLDSVIKRLKDAKITEVTLMPFMIVAGDHANNDMASDEDDSWKTLLTKAGIKVNVYLHGIGENSSIRAIYVDHAKAAE